MKVLECLCNRPKEEDSRGRLNDRGDLRVGMEHTCIVLDGKGSCGDDFYEDEDEPCRWCCQIIKRED